MRDINKMIEARKICVELNTRIDELSLLFNMTKDNICPLCKSEFSRDEFKKQYHELMLESNELDPDYQHIEYTVDGKRTIIKERD